MAKTLIGSTKGGKFVKSGKGGGGDGGKKGGGGKKVGGGGDG